jgi:hypothetical protein
MAMPTSSAMTATATNSSMSVNPCSLVFIIAQTVRPLETWMFIEANNAGFEFRYGNFSGQQKFFPNYS